jgi:hypothetical protein
MKRNILNYFSVKVALSILGLAVSIPLFSLFYWSFDSAYLAAFGVGPEIFSRPVFSSKLMLTWFVLGAITPSIWIIGGAAVAMAIVLFGIHYRAKRPGNNTSQTTATQSDRVENQPVRMIDIIDRSLTPPIYLFLSPLLMLLFLLIGMTFMSKKAERLALNQIDAYVQKGSCPDTFNNQLNGCYSISDELASNYFIIANNEKMVIYLSRDQLENEVLVLVTIKDKLSNKKVVRELKRVLLSDIASRTEEKS